MFGGALSLSRDVSDKIYGHLSEREHSPGASATGGWDLQGDRPAGFSMAENRHNRQQEPRMSSLIGSSFGGQQPTNGSSGQGAAAAWQQQRQVASPLVPSSPDFGRALLKVPSSIQWLGSSCSCINFSIKPEALDGTSSSGTRRLFFACPTLKQAAPSGDHSASAQIAASAATPGISFILSAVLRQQEAPR